MCCGQATRIDDEVSPRLMICTLNMCSILLWLSVHRVFVYSQDAMFSMSWLSMQYDQDIVDLLTSLKAESVTSEGGMYAAAMPPPPPEPKAEADDSWFSLRGPAAKSPQVSRHSVLQPLLDLAK